MASLPRQRSARVDSNESQYCDLSGRGLTSEQIDRTLRVFATADTIDLSNNEIGTIPLSLSTNVTTLDVSFNAISSIHGIERLQFVQELHLAYNRLNDVSALEFCPRLIRVNLSGNRLMTTKGLETLEWLENLDMSDNLIELPEALRALSLNQNLTHLMIRGNPLSQRSRYHVPILDMIPSLVVLDDKKRRSTVKRKTKDVSSTTSLSYSRIYDDKKQFMIYNQARLRPVATVKGNLAPKYDGTMFLPPQIEPTHERARAEAASISPLVAPFPPHSPLRYRVTPYLSMYDRLAQSNGRSVNKHLAPFVKPISDHNPAKRDAAALQYNATTRIQKSIPLPSRHLAASPSTVSHKCNWQEPQQQQQQRTPQNPSGASARRSSDRIDTPAPIPRQVLDDKQRNMLSVIQNLIHHKRQTLANLGGQKINATHSSARSRGNNQAGQIVQ